MATTEKHYGKFKKAGSDRVRTAASPAEAVALRYEGWTEDKPATAPPPEKAAEPKKS